MRALCRVLPALLTVLAISADRAAEGQQAKAVAAGVTATEATDPTAPKPPIVGRYPRFKELLWSGTGYSLLSIGDSRLAAWSPSQGLMFQMFTLKNHPCCLATAPGSTKVALGNNYGAVEIWDIQSWTLDRRLEMGESDPIYAVALSNDGKLLACVGPGKDPQMKIWNLADGMLLHSLGERGGALVFSPDGTQLAGIARGSLKVWNISDGKLAHALPCKMKHYVRYAPDGKTLILIERGIVTFWNPESEQPERTVLAPQSIAPIPNRRHGLSANSRGATFAGATDVSPDAKYAASVTKEGTVAIWSLETREIVNTLPAVPTEASHPGSLGSLLYSPDGHRLAAVGTQQGVIFWEVPPMD